MMTTTLSTLQQTRLLANAQPSLTAIDLTITSLKAARDAWMPEHDNREQIEQLAQQLSENIADLSSVKGDDLVEARRQMLWNERANALSGSFQRILQNFHMVATEEEGTKTARKRVTRAFRELRELLKAFAQGSDNRAAMVAVVNTIRTEVRELQTLDERLDRWAPKLTLGSCDSFLALCSQEILSALPPEIPSRPFNAVRVELNDHLRDFIGALGPLNLSKGEVGASFHDRQAIVTRANDLQRETAANLHEEISQPGEILDRVLAIQTDVEDLLQRSASLSPLRVIAQDAALLVRPTVRRISALLTPLVRTASPQPTGLLSNILSKFGWAEPELA